MDSDQALIPIACRFVASDQWLTAHFDPTWKISEVKQYILAKVYNRSVDNDHLPSRDRPVSPITFASTRTSFDSNLEGSLHDDHIIDLEPSEPARQLRMRQPLSQRVASPSGVSGSPTEPAPAIIPPHHYPMLAFSTGQVLEDDCTLAWYRLRPHELLELHPPGTIVRLQRDVMLEYVKPYFELDVRALRVIVNDKDTSHAFGPSSYVPDLSSPYHKNKRLRDPASGESLAAAVAGGGSPAASQSTRKRRKTKLEWRDRYLVIRQGMLSLFKSRTDLTPVHTCSLAKLTTLRGQDEVVHTATAALPSPHVVCAKFLTEVSPPSIPEPQPLTSPMTEQWNDPWSGATIPRETEGFLWGRRESKEDIKQLRRNTAEGTQQLKVQKEDLFEGRTPDAKGDSLRCDINIGDGTQGTWLVLDTLDEHAHSNLLRVFHRCSPDTISSTLVPKYFLPDSSFSSPSSLSSPLPSLTGSLYRSPCPYPEWRIEVSQRAQQSGVGNVSDAMAWVLRGGPPPGPSAPVSRRISSTELHRKFSDLTTEDSSTVHEPFNFDGDDDGGDDVDCELEWESWVQDLMRQALASSSNDISVTVTEPASAHPSYPHKRIRPTASSSTFSSVTPSEHGRRPSDILPGANMGLLSVNSPALLTAPSVLPFQSTGFTTSTVSAGGIVRTRSLITANGGRGRGVAQAMDVLSEDGGNDGSFSGRHRADRQKRTREENSRGAMASSAPTHSSSMPAPAAANTITSTVTVRESCGGTPSPPPLQFHSSPGSPRATSSSALASTSASPVLVAGSGTSDTASMRSGITTMTSTTTIQLPPPRRSSVAGETTLLPEASPPSRKRRDKTEKEKEKGKGKGKQSKSPTRGKVFRPERLVSKLDSALDFVTG